MRSNEAIFKSFVLKSMRELKREIVYNMDVFGRNATRRSIRSLKENVVIDSQGFHGIIEGNKSFNFMEEGSGPHRPGAGSIFYLIYEWVKAKGIVPDSRVRGKTIDKKRRRMATAIANIIKAKGTELHRYRRKEDIMTSAIDRQTIILMDKASELLFKATVEQEFNKL